MATQFGFTLCNLQHIHLGGGGCLVSRLPGVSSISPDASVSQGQAKVKRAGRCCDECAAAKGSCLYEGTVRYHGDMWNGTGCEFCSCSRGQVVCQRAECGRVQCPQVSVSGRRPNGSTRVLTASQDHDRRVHGTVSR